jgi:hypothetical protein
MARDAEHFFMHLFVEIKSKFFEDSVQFIHPLTDWTIWVCSGGFFEFLYHKKKERKKEKKKKNFCIYVHQGNYRGFFCYVLDQFWYQGTSGFMELIL